jgi:HK97 family phage major capsid protein
MDTAERLADEIKSIWAHADDEGRELSPEERVAVNRRLERIEQARDGKSIGELLNGGGDNNGVRAGDGSGRLGGDPGRVFIESEGFKRISDASHRGQNWTTGPVELPLMTKGTLLEGTGAPGTGTGGGLIPAPDVVPGVVQKLLAPPLGVADLFGSFTVTTNTVRYAIEGTATSGATGVAEAAAKPESTLVLSTVDEPVKKIATSLVVSDEMLDDAAAAQGFINGELSRFISIEEEDQLLRGTGTNDLVGVVGRSGVNTYARGTVDNNAVALAKVVANTRGSSYVEPDAIVMSPANWMATRLLTDSTGNFLGDGPFGGGPGGGGGPGLFGGMLWNKPVVLSDVIGAGTALVGNFSTAAAIARRSGITVEASNSHSDFFLSDKVAFRAEMRLALAVYRPAAFTLVSGLS